ncbi:rhodanese-like domain-containing protein [Altibacter sp.]|uniref:rhodanese-like domain-containing protein n=1 Tax=Altibacter sp. TaxID=2024823 RepID=UPI000C89EE39|nr:rhodanese-like domain-containing protein [Altibacter sp.]MAP55296.1 rhodanese [Altibacter sp.]|tara:strand:+ start:509 stop:1006 length:498 start_codon:yes stop_codon:yes gene_type:complete
MKKISYILLLLMTFSATAQESLDALLKQYNTHSVPYISVEELRRLQVNDTVVILDAREITEFGVSHIDNARYVGFSAFSSEALSEIITNKNSAIVVYCSLGIRSEVIAEKLKDAGYTNVRNLYGGIFEWKNKGYTVVDSTRTETENIHAFSKAWSKWLTNGNKVY